MTFVATILDEVERRLVGVRWTFANELALQDRLCALFFDMSWRREVVLGENRLDFAIEVSPGTMIAVEVKIAGSPAEWLRQCHRYAELPEVAAVILITSRGTGFGAVAGTTQLAGKPFRAVHARRAAW